ncbi:MAG: tetratricopeptide repeat protein [Muribaculaceae bacterium]|nr:tetratricopeptide repeat protein [Muribaculaceae bacterium]
MTNKEAVKIHSTVRNLLSERRLNESFNMLRKYQLQVSDPKMIDKLNQLEDTYKYMIHYLVEGYHDSGREAMLVDIINQIARLNDMALRDSIISDSDDIYSSTLRLERIQHATFKVRVDNYIEAHTKADLADCAGGDNEIKREEERALTELFSYVWTMFGAPLEEYKELTRLVISPDMKYNFKAQMISAMLLGNLKYYDRNALNALMDIYDSEPNAKIAARTLVAIFLIVASNPDRIIKDPQLKARLTLWQDSIIIYPQLREILMNMIKARDTERINKKMQNELLPEIMKLRPEILSRLKNASEEMDIESLEENPEWEEILNKNGVADKLKELTEMQLDGGDVMMMAFSNLKTFPFFNSVANWFLPFSSSHTEVKGNSNASLAGFTELLDMEGVMCDSDKYSFAFSLNRMPPEQRKMISDRMNAEISQLKELMEEKKIAINNREFDSEVTRYIRNLYRFFKLFRRKTDFNDPFEVPIDFRNLPVISEVLSESEILKLVGEFYFKRGYYKEALPLFLSLEKSNSEMTDLWEKIGYCYNAMNKLEEALTWYRKAELINPDSQWLIKKLALVCRMLNKNQEAAEYYEKALSNDYDNYKLLISTGNCLLEANRPADALRHYYHAEYIMPGKVSTLRAIAWCELLNGNITKSFDTYKRILSSEEATSTDYLNAGHVAFISNDLKDAVAYYLKCARDEKFGLTNLETAIMADLSVIENAGGDRNTLNIVIDKVRYEL